MGTPSSITRTGKHEPWGLQVSRGQIAFHETVFKYGYNPLIINANETIWDVGGLYAYPSSAVAMTATSASGATDAGVTGIILGLDSDYNEVSEEFTLDGSGAYTTTQTFLRVYRAYITGSTAPAGNINIANGGTTYARITAGENQTLMTVYTVPAGKTLYIEKGTATHGTDTSGAYMTVRFVVRNYGSVFRTAFKFDLIGQDLQFDFEYPLVVPEKSDIEVRAICSKNQNNAMASSFQAVLIDNVIPLS
jgi:hypothetical protein